MFSGFGGNGALVGPPRLPPWRGQDVHSLTDGPRLGDHHHHHDLTPSYSSPQSSIILYVGKIYDISKLCYLAFIRHSLSLTFE